MAKINKYWGLVAVGALTAAAAGAVAALVTRKKAYEEDFEDDFDDLDDFEKIYNPQNLSGDKSIMDRSRRDHSADEYRSETK